MVHIAEIWNQPKYPIPDEWMKKMCYIHTMEYHLAVKKSKILWFPSICLSGENDVEWNNTYSEKQIPDVPPYIRDLFFFLNHKTNKESFCITFAANTVFSQSLF